MGNNQLNKHFSSYVFRTPSASILNSVIGTGIVTVAGWSIDKSDEFFYLLFFIFSFYFFYSILLPRGVGEDLLSPPLGRIRIGSFFFRCQVTKKGRMFCQFKIKPYLCNMLGVPHESHALEAGSRGIKRESGESPELSP